MGVIKYHKQVVKAAKEGFDLIVNHKLNFIVVAAGMQAGKTEYIACMHELLEKKYSKMISLYVTAHNHLDFREQNWERLKPLEPSNLYCLTLADRRKDKIKNKIRSSKKIVVFFDESHFGDGLKQSIDKWIERNNLKPNHRVIFIGVSATPFSSIERAWRGLKKINPIISFDLKLMPKYKSVTHMLKKDLIIEPDQLIQEKRGKRIRFFPESNVFLHLEQLAKNKVNGYVIIRVRNKKQAWLLEKNIKVRIKTPKVLHWSQGNKLKPEIYFNEIREDLIVVIVQKKAAMGNSINTKYIHFVYDYSPNAALSTIAQGLLGRCCGHNKKNHPVTVYTHYKHAYAYSLFENKKMQEFIEFLKDHKIRPSQRSVVYKSSVPIYTDKIKLKKPIENRKEAREITYKVLKKQFKENLYIKDTITTRFLSAQKNKTQRRWYLERIAAGFNPVETRGIEKIVGKTAVFYDHRNLVLYIGHRIEGECEYTIEAKPQSFYTKI